MSTTKNNKKQVYRINFKNENYKYKQNRTKFLYTPEYSLYRFDEKETAEFNGTVYNIEVEGDNSYIANGVAVHNCWKPSREGMIYPRLSRHFHQLTPAQIAELITGDPYPERFSKNDLLNFFKKHDVSYAFGCDHGFNHCFAGVLGARWANFMFIIDAFEVPGLELDGKIKILESRIKKFDPDVYADTSHPGDNTTISRHGFKVRKWKKGPGSVVDGIGTVRMKLNPLMQRPELYFLKGDSNVEHLFDRLMKYAWVIDQATGEPTDVPNDKDDDGPDALRYLVMNVFGNKGKLTISKGQNGNPLALPHHQLEQNEIKKLRWNQIMDHVGMDQDDLSESDPSPQTKGNKRIKWLI